MCLRIHKVVPDVLDDVVLERCLIIRADVDDHSLGTSQFKQLHAGWYGFDGLKAALYVRLLYTS